LGLDKKEDLMSDFKEEERSSEAREPTKDAWKKARLCNKVGTDVQRRPKLRTGSTATRTAVRGWPCVATIDMHHGTAVCPSGLRDRAAF